MRVSLPRCCVRVECVCVCVCVWVSLTVLLCVQVALCVCVCVCVCVSDGVAAVAQCLQIKLCSVHHLLPSASAACHLLFCMRTFFRLLVRVCPSVTVAVSSAVKGRKRARKGDVRRRRGGHAVREENNTGERLRDDVDVDRLSLSPSHMRRDNDDEAHTRIHVCHTPFPFRDSVTHRQTDSDSLALALSLPLHLLHEMMQAEGRQSARACCCQQSCQLLLHV